MTLAAAAALVLSHFTAVILFSLFASVVFAITLREELREQIRYGVMCFVYFLAGTFLAGWVLYLLNPH
ncbi:MAG TPA: hypothetical protein VE996_13400 [Terriglobales bacterium]|nr:hypothetical protein [Terriglobales bacterium]